MIADTAAHGARKNGRFGSATSVRGSARATSARRSAAAAIIAALSVQKRRSGTNAGMPRCAPSATNADCSAPFAATPPLSTIARYSFASSARVDAVDQHVDDRRLKRRGDVFAARAFAGVRLEKIAHRRLQAREAHVERARHRRGSAETRSPWGCRRARAVPARGRRGTADPAAARFCRTPRRPRRRASCRSRAGPSANVTSTSCE